MPIQTLHLRSNVQGKEPVAGTAAGQLPVGSIGINFNKDEPFLTIQDSAGAIRRIAGIKVGAAAPASPTAGEAWLDISVATKPVFKVHDGTAWQGAGSGVSTGSAAPAAPAAGDLWVDTTTATAPVLKVYNGTAFVAVTPDATDAVKGVVELATATETVDGVDTTRAVTPAGLKSALGAQAGSSTAPAAPVVGQVWVDNSTSPSVVKVWGGTPAAWIPQVGGTVTGTTAPTTPVAGTIWVDTSATPNVVKIWDGTAWVTATPDGSAAAAIANDAKYATKAELQAEDLWDRSGTEVTPKNAGDSVFTSGAVKVGGTTAAPNLQIKADGGIVANTNGLVYDAAQKRLGLGTSTVGNALHIVTSSTTATARGITLSNTNANTANGMAEIDFYTDQYDGSTLNNKARITASLDASSSTAGYLAFSTRKSGVMTEAVRIDSQSRVGIGSTAPNRKLEVSDASADNFIRVNTTGTTKSGIEFASGGTVYSQLYFNNVSPYDLSILQQYTTGSLILGTNSTERARIDSSGRLLVGTSSQLGNGIIQAKANSDSSTGEGILLLAKGDGATAEQNLGQIKFTNSSGNQAAWITAVADTGWGGAGSADYPGRLVFSTTADGASSPTERMRIGQSGTTDIYSTPTDAGFTSRVSHGAGTTYGFFSGKHSATSTATGANVFFVYTNGNVVNTNNSYGALSDIKLKENIVDAGSQWDDLKALQVRKYNFKEGQTHKQIGLVAQEVEIISPGLVYETPDRDDDGNALGTVTKSVNYSVLYMKAVKALQEAMERIEQLEAKVAALEPAAPQKQADPGSK